jgi:hypothetical protein
MGPADPKESMTPTNYFASPGEALGVKAYSCRLFLVLPATPLICHPEPPRSVSQRLRIVGLTRLCFPVCLRQHGTTYLSVVCFRSQSKTHYKKKEKYYCETICEAARRVAFGPA